MKNKKIIFILIKLAIVIGLIVLLYKQINKIDNDDWHNLKVLRIDFIIYAFLLLFFNWGVEWLKWRNILDLIQIKGEKPILKIFQSFMAGILTGLLTPNMLGNFIGRMYYFDRKDRSNIILGTFITNYSQFFASVFFGLISIIILRETPWSITINQNYFVLIILIISILLLFYFFIEKIKLKSLTRKVSYIYFVSLLTAKPSFRIKILWLSIFRHFIFTLQFWLIFNAFEKAFDLDTFFWIWQIFLWTTLLPSLWFGKLIIRESMALIVLGSIGYGQLEILTASVLLWLINLAIPSLLSLFICKQKLVK